MVPGTDYSDIGFYCSYHVQQATTNSLPVGLRSSTTADKAFQHLKALVITKSVFKLKMVGDNVWNFRDSREVFQCFAKNCKTYAM